MKSLKKITNEAEYVDALSNVLNTYKAFPGTSEYQERESLLRLIKEYEDQKLNNSSLDFSNSKKSII